MGVIGVVAALTLPNLNSSTGDKEKVAKVKKLYQNLSDATGRAWVVYDNKINENRIIEFLKISKNCGQTGSGCESTSAKKLDNSNGDILSEYGSHAEVGYTYLLADGTALAIGGYTDYFAIDIDGPNKGANTWGKDLFAFDINNGEVYPIGYKLTDAQLKDSCFKTGVHCTGWVVQNENMDYLKADRTGKCPNGTQLSWTNTTCK